MALDLVCDGLGFPEGPVWMRDGSIVLVEIRSKRISRIAPDGTRTTVAEVDGGPNGAAIGPDGALYVCNNGGMAFVDAPDGGSIPVGSAADYTGGSIQRVDLATGAVATLYTHSDGRALSSPNDIVFDAHGGMWFTDMGRTANHAHDVGAIHYALPDGSAIRTVRDGMHSPNGIGLSPDQRRLYVAETITSRLWAHDVVAPGQIGAAGTIWTPGQVMGPLPGYQLLDSLAVDAQGDICVATLINGGITIFAADGSGTTHLPVPDLATTNICFGGDTMCDAWITASSTGRLYKARWPRPGLPMSFTA
ncbi:gluconolaconase [Sphingomonas sp. Leaf412]|nr:gluconolaconase [Sphingomonas sp. Leaf412]